MSACTCNDDLFFRSEHIHVVNISGQRPFFFSNTFSKYSVRGLPICTCLSRFFHFVLSYPQYQSKSKICHDCRSDMCGYVPDSTDAFPKRTAICFKIQCNLRIFLVPTIAPYLATIFLAYIAFRMCADLFDAKYFCLQLP